MTRYLYFLFCSFFISQAAFTSQAIAELSPGQKAPPFALKSAAGKRVSLVDLKGKVVVLEWLNHGCPFVRKHYDSGNMQKLQSEFTEKGVVWISIISSAEGKQGYSTPDKALQDKAKYKSKATHILLDKDGRVGRAYGAKVTPHMYVLNKKGEVLYLGGIDSISSANKEDIKNARPFVKEALNSILSGGKVKVKESRAYGCSVKY